MKSILEEMRTVSTADSPAKPQAKPPSLLEPDYADDYTRWKNEPTPKNTTSLLNAVRPIIDSGLRTYGGGSASSPILRSRAKMLTIDAMHRYDPSKSKLRSHLLINLQGLHRERANEEAIIHMPERMRLARAKLTTAAEELRDRLGREASDAELQEHTGLPLSHIAKIRKNSKIVAEGQLSSGGDDENETFDPAVADTRPNNAWLRFVYLDLDNFDKVILERTTGLHGKEILPKNKIAALLGISPGAVSQRLARIQTKLDVRDVAGSLL
jgi:DNA-directed RNA polymerase specialized sigma subunit